MEKQKKGAANALFFMAKNLSAERPDSPKQAQQADKATDGVQRKRAELNSRAVENRKEGEGFKQNRWWAMLGSNQRPLPCEGSALPLS
ncbi:hypothetical protein BN873_10089 [Candidatus Competibacter denitrificans Run_A_D11]|uniref:Uncharacterized protein n=1 Tax=Candidatus Competibacter denitrificans Run_A_D11 TaxID=1400863 RepID=W6MAP1_9GAMM|nr:hypothetical protein BN873_10089 [Candidatus Competibacter denitrificans Run_A_D11]